MLARRHPYERDAILKRALAQHDRLVWRGLRPLLRELVLTLLQAGVRRQSVTSLYWRVNKLEYLQGIRDAGGIPVPRPVRVLCYHSVADLEGAGLLEPYGVPPDRFRRQLGFLTRRFRPIDAAEFRSFLEGGGVPRRAVLVTFDDGLHDLRDVAVPILRNLNVPAVAFAVTAFAGGSSDWVADEEVRRPLLDTAALKELARDDISVQSHTRTHRSLRGQSTAEIDNEIRGSVRDLAAAGLERPSFVAYPYGEFDERAVQAAKAAGLAGAFTTIPGIARPGHEPFAIPRIEILRGDGPLRFMWKVCTGGPGLAGSVRTLVRRRRAHCAVIAERPSS
jgi:peptidoglycan/xylan/chitin deacetylase (PgdA/CDA1 family)